MHKKILALAIPNIVTNITIPLLGMVDLGLMGHMGSEVYLGAVALGTMIFNFIFWSFGFLRMGTSGFTAQAYGSRNLRESMHVLTRGLTVGFFSGLLLIALQIPISRIAFSLIGGSEEVQVLARDYVRIRIWASPATLCLYALTGWFIGMQNAKIPMTLAITVNVLNIAFSLFFIKILHMNVNGIALANVCSQTIGLATGLVFLKPWLRRLKAYINIHEALKYQAMQTFFHVNKDIFIRTLCLIFTLTFFTTQSARTSNTILAVNTLLFQLFYFFSYFVDGFGYAAEALTGRYIGAGDSVRLREVIRKLFIWGLGIAGIFTLVYGSCGAFILRLLTDNPEIIEQARPYLFWTVVVPMVTFPAFIWDGIYIGATASVAMRNAMLVATFVIFTPAYYLLNQSMSNHGLWLAMLLFMAFRGILLTRMSAKHIYQPLVLNN